MIVHAYQILRFASKIIIFVVGELILYPFPNFQIPRVFLSAAQFRFLDFGHFVYWHLTSGNIIF